MYIPWDKTSSPLPPSPSPPPHQNMGWCDGRDSASPPYLTDQQQQQGPSLRVTQALELYRACVAAGQWVRFSVEQRVEGEFISFVSKPPAAAATAAAAATRKRKKMNKRRAERQRKWRETQGSSSAAARAQQQPLPAGSQQQQQQLQATASYSSILQQQIPVPQAAAAGYAQHTRAVKPAAAAPTMETRSSKKRRIALSPGGATAPGPAVPVNPSPPPPPVCSFIPQTDGAEEAPTTPPAHQEPERMPESEMMPEACYRPAPPPPPMTRLSRSPHHVLCRRCSEKQHSVHFKYCYKCQ